MYRKCTLGTEKIDVYDTYRGKIYDETHMMEATCRGISAR